MNIQHQTDFASARLQYGSAPGPVPASAITLRRLPAIPMPADGEAFASWVDRTANTLDVPAGIAVRALGLEYRNRSSAARPAFFGLTLTSTGLAALRKTTGLPARVLWQMQLARYDGTALDLSCLDQTHSKATTSQLRNQWLLDNSSRACPHCLGQSPEWLLWWRLGIAAVCPTHQCLLVDTCPACGIVLRRGRGGKRPGGLLVRPNSPPEPRECGNRLKHSGGPGQPTVCRQPIASIPAQPVPNVLVELQQHALDIANGGAALIAGEPVPGSDWFAAVRYLTAAARLVEHNDEIAELPAHIADILAEDRRHRDERRFIGGAGHIGAKPQTAAQAAAVLALTAHLLDAPDRETSTRRLAPWARRLAERRATEHKGNDPLRELRRPPVLEQMLTAAVPHPSRLLAPLRTTPTLAIEFRYIPHLIDLDDYHDVMATQLPGATPLAGRHLCALALARLAGAESWDHAAKALNGPGHDHYRKRGVPQRIADPEAFWTATRTVADRLLARGLIDYYARRTALSDLYEVPYSVLFPIFYPLALDVTRSRQRHAAGWIWQRLTGSRPHDAPAYAESWEGTSTRGVNRGRRLFAQVLPTAAADALESWGIEWLAERGVE
ncbi:TniQ family protein [Streptomyces sp. NPDC088726]|uniref:TniQ family protein n=1 Tax=Streptomyces sp. NPDC088726 TaxID=3365874 RepID=UPI0037F7B916